MDNLGTKFFKQAHLDVFKVNPDHKQVCFDSAEMYEQLGNIGQCGIHIVDGRILYMSAWMMIAPGVAEVFLHPSVYVPIYPKTFLKHVKWWLKYLLAQENIHRLQTAGANTPKSDRWLQAIGFCREGVLESYLENGDSISIWGMLCRQ